MSNLGSRRTGPHLNAVVLSLPGLGIPPALRKVTLEEVDVHRSQLHNSHLAYLALHLLHRLLVAVDLLLGLRLVPRELLLHQVQLVCQSSTFNLQEKLLKGRKYLTCTPASFQDQF